MMCVVLHSKGSDMRLATCMASPMTCAAASTHVTRRGAGSALNNTRSIASEARAHALTMLVQRPERVHGRTNDVHTSARTPHFPTCPPHAAPPPTRRCTISTPSSRRQSLAPDLGPACPIHPGPPLPPPHRRPFSPSFPRLIRSGLRPPLPDPSWATVGPSLPLRPISPLAPLARSARAVVPPLPPSPVPDLTPWPPLPDPPRAAVGSPPPYAQSPPGPPCSICSGRRAPLYSRSSPLVPLA